MHLTLIYSTRKEGQQVISIINVPAPADDNWSATENEEVWFERNHPTLAAVVADDLFVGWVYSNLQIEGCSAHRIVVPADENSITKFVEPITTTE